MIRYQNLIDFLSFTYEFIDKHGIERCKIQISYSGFSILDIVEYTRWSISSRNFQRTDLPKIFLYLKNGKPFKEIIEDKNNEIRECIKRLNKIKAFL